MAGKRHEYSVALSGTDPPARMHVRFTTQKGRLLKYAVALLYQPPGESERAVRLYDYTHGVHDDHRYDRAGVKQPATVWHHGSAQEGFNAALDLISADYATIINAWLQRPHP